METNISGIDGDVGINLEKARSFASHYGKYSYEEVEHMRNGASNGNTISGCLLDIISGHSRIFLLFPYIF